MKYFSFTILLFLFIQSSPAQNTWQKIEAGTEFSLALKSDGTLWAWGFNANGQLTGQSQAENIPFQISEDRDWADIAVGAVQCFAIKEDGSLWAWGFNLYGQLGIGGSQQAVRSIERVGSDTSWVQVEAGLVHSLARKRDGSIWSCGFNNAGQLGNADPEEEVDTFRRVDNHIYIDIATGGFHSLAIRADSSLWGWGDNSGDQINGAISTDIISRPTIIDTVNLWVNVECGFQYSAALTEAGRLYTWGFNGNGQLGLGFASNNPTGQPTLVDSSAQWIFISPGASFMHAIQSDSTLWGWGFNGLGQLGIGNEIQQNQPTQVGQENNWTQVSNARGLFLNNSVFGLHTLGLKGDARSICATGANYQSQLGNGNTVNRSTFDCSILDLSVSSIQADEQPLTFKVYPNPTRDHVTIESMEAVRWKEAVIYALNGQLVQQYALPESNRTSLRLGNLPAGLYFLRLQTVEGQNYTQKLIIHQ